VVPWAHAAHVRQELHIGGQGVRRNGALRTCGDEAQCARRARPCLLRALLQIDLGAEVRAVELSQEEHLTVDHILVLKVWARHLMGGQVERMAQGGNVGTSCRNDCDAAAAAIEMFGRRYHVVTN